MNEMLGQARESAKDQYAEIKMKINEKKKRLLFQSRLILDGLVEKYSYKVPLSEFLDAFSSRTHTDFKKRFLKLQKYIVTWSLADFFQDIPHESVVYMLFENRNGVKFIVSSDVESPPPETEDYVRRENPELSPREGNGPFNSWAAEMQEAVMFSPPSWPFLSSSARMENQIKYKHCMLGQSIDNRECQKLAFEWWRPQVKKFSQILLALRNVSRCLNGGYFMLDELDETLLKVFPNEWLSANPVPRINYNSFGLSKSKMLELNLVVRYDVDDPNKFCVNELISHLNFEMIREEIPSLIYDYADKHSYVFVKEVDLMLCRNIKSYERHPRADRLEHLHSVLDRTGRLFDVRNDSLQTIRNRDLFLVPLHFSPDNN